MPQFASAFATPALVGRRWKDTSGLVKAKRPETEKENRKDKRAKKEMVLRKKGKPNSEIAMASKGRKDLKKKTENNAVVTCCMFVGNTF